MNSHRFGVSTGTAAVRIAVAGLFLVTSLLVGFTPASAAGPNAVDVASDYVQKNFRQLGLTGSDVHDMVVTSVVPSRHTGVTHVYFQQTHRGIGVYNGILNVNVGADGQVLGAGSRFVSGLASAAAGQNPKRTVSAAAAAAAGHLGLHPNRAFEVLARKGSADERVTLSTGGVAARPIDAKLVWVPTGGAVRLGWSLEIEELDGRHWWIALVDAQTGASLGWDDLVLEDSLQATGEALVRPFAGEAILPAFAPTDGARYNVFPLPFESPDTGARSLVANAADPNASPFGWHDTDGVAGPEFTRTRGNNVHAYTDLDANNVADPGSDPDGGPGLLFDFPLDLTDGPASYRPAAVTNLFYWNNVIHDVLYAYGFDPASGNFQVNTYGQGGVGNDDVRAEAQDGSNTNNANFATGVDGVRPRMQMFVWNHPFPNLVTVTSPLGIAGDFPASRATFGPTLNVTGPISAPVVLVDDGVGTPSDACEPLVGFPAGAIALLDRGICSFVIKAKIAQDAGASAVLVVNNVAGNPITMSGTDPTLVIPTVMVSLDAGDLFKANLPISATLRANALTSVDRDSDLDAGVIAHEYGHGVSNRLTGGPAVVNCLNNAEQMGEGWSDFLGLVMTASASDTVSTARGIGNYVTFRPPNGPGIRPTPYSTDLTVNPSTYATVADVANVSRPHGIGYVWNTMLYEMYWNLVDRHGFNPNIYDTWSTGGNNLAIQLVIDGMKFQPCRPGFVDGRNGILQADLALTGGANQCEIWRAFAKRGLGFSADQGSPLNRADGIEAFDLPVSCTAAVFGGFEPPVYDAPTINDVNGGSIVPVKFSLAGASGSLSIDMQEVDCNSLEPTGQVPQAPATVGGGLTATGGGFHFNWKTEKAWAGTCRRLTLRIPAAADAVAYFSFF